MSFLLYLIKEDSDVREEVGRNKGVRKGERQKDE